MSIELTTASDNTINSIRESLSAASSQAFRQSLGDSGDGNGYDTLQLHPDASLSSSDQYLIIDPTSPGHIHIRAGGTQDDSSAELYLGAEKNYVRVIDSGPDTGIRIQNEAAGFNSYPFVAPTGYTSGTWYTSNGSHFLQLTSTDSVFLNHLETFMDGAPNFIQFWSAGQPPADLTYVPNTFSQDGDVLTFQVNEGHGLGETQVAEEIVINVYTPRINRLELDNNDISIYATADVRIEGDDDVRIYAGDSFLLANYAVDEPVTIATNYDQGPSGNEWNFNADGTLTFPDSTVQTTAYQTGQITVLLNADTETEATGYTVASLSGNVIVFAPEAEYTNQASHSVTIPAPNYAGQKLTLLSVYTGGTITVNWPIQNEVNWNISIEPFYNKDLTAFITPEDGLVWWETAQYIW